jgi:hypothetical protein
VWAFTTVLSSLYGFGAFEAVGVGVASTIVALMLASFGYRARRDHTEVRH